MIDALKAWFKFIDLVSHISGVFHQSQIRWRSVMAAAGRSLATSFIMAL